MGKTTTKAAAQKRHRDRFNRGEFNLADKPAPVEGVRFPCKVFSPSGRLVKVITPKEQKAALDPIIDPDNFSKQKY